jgi:hypothetical protein
MDYSCKWYKKLTNKEKYLKSLFDDLKAIKNEVKEYNIKEGQNKLRKFFGLENDNVFKK